jgi:hypothetical protein
MPVLPMMVSHRVEGHTRCADSTSGPLPWVNPNLAWTGPVDRLLAPQLLTLPAISSHKIDQEIGTRMTGFKYSRHRPTSTRVRTLSKAVTRGHVVLIDV